MKAFYSVTPSENFGDGAVSCLNLSGIGKLVPNMMLMGFKNNWMDDLGSVPGYINVIHHGFDMRLAVGILRLKDGCDYSAVIGQEEQIIIPDSGDHKGDDDSDDGSNDVKDDIVKTAANLVVEKSAARKTSVAVYHGVDGNPLEKKLVEDITQFQV